MSNEEMKEESYRLRGEAVAVASHADWILAELASQTSGTLASAGRTQHWNDLKRFLADHDMTDALQQQLFRTREMHKARDRAAHDYYVTASIGNTVEMWRVDQRKGYRDTITLDDLQDEVKVARHGFDALREIGRAVRDHHPGLISRQVPIQIPSARRRLTTGQRASPTCSHSP